MTFPGFSQIILIALLLVLNFLLSQCGHKAGPPYSPAEALKTMQIEKGFRIELFASEPDISDPVAMEFDENGRIYVVEMHGYPLDTSPSGKVKLLEDTNGDGRPDRSTVFADKLVLPTGVMRWKKGILVTAAPDVWYFEDTDGDGRADVRKVVLTGFAFSNPQHTVNNPVYGLDNWIYLAHEGPSRGIIFKEFADPGKDIRFPERSDIPAQDVGDRSVRFRPDTYQLEALSGKSQFGHTFDEWGHYFTLNNSNHGRHEVIAARYLKRNPDLLVSSAMQDLSDHGNAAKVYPINPNPRIEMLTEFGQFTSACGLTLYLGGAFPAEFHRGAFVAEPVHNLVHRDIVADARVSFVAKRAQEGVEFLASTDGWFRPVNFTIGPDGALYLVDYYRQVIEHPEWTSTHVHRSKDLYNGSDQGRIYRIRQDSQPPLPLPRNVRLGEATDADLVKQLANPNLWWRRNAQRLLVDRRSDHSIVLLVRVFQDRPSALARLHALWTLEGLGKLEPSLIEKALQDGEPGLRENAIRLAELHLSVSPSLAPKLLKLSGDPDPKVRFQLLCTLGFIDSPQSRAVQDKLLIENIEDEWMQLAALSASSDRASQFFQMAAVRKGGLTSDETKGRRAFFRLVSSVIGARQRVDEIYKVLATVADHRQSTSEWWRVACLEGLAAGVRNKRADVTAWKASRDVLLRLFDGPSAGLRHASLQLLKAVGLSPGPTLERTLKRALTTAENTKADPAARADAIGLLTLSDTETQEALLKKLVDPQEPDPVQIAAVRAIGQIRGEEVGRFLLSKWRTFGPQVRSEAADALLLDPGRNTLILNAVKNEDIPPWMLNFWQKRKLLMNRDPKVREIARTLLDEKPGEREKVLKQCEAALHMQGDLARGEQVFKKACSKCHKMNGVGAEVGPDLGTVRNRPASVLLSDILMPSKSIAQNYEAYVVETASGGLREGVMGSQTPTSITLRQEEGKEIVIPRQDIKRIYVANLSAMPADLDRQVNVQQMADLLKFITMAK